MTIPRPVKTENIQGTSCPRTIATYRKKGATTRIWKRLIGICVELITLSINERYTFVAFLRRALLLLLPTPVSSYSFRHTQRCLGTYWAKDT